jgi:hypothetical protein
MERISTAFYADEGMPKMDRTVTKRVEAVLMDHLKKSIEGCICGWSELGKRHPGHQAKMLEEAGLLITERV